MVTDDTSKLGPEFIDKLRTVYPDNFLTNKQVALLVNNTPDKAHLEALSFFLSHALKSLPDKKYAGQLLFNHVDESPYSLEEWIKALLVFKKYLDSNKKNINVETIFGYIGCCSDSPENKLLKYNLPDLLQKMLDEYGYIG